MNTTVKMDFFLFGDIGREREEKTNRRASYNIYASGLDSPDRCIIERESETPELGLFAPRLSQARQSSNDRGHFTCSMVVARLSSA